ncbi:MAG: hypothetical protein NTV75_10675 [Bacteroidia bacterium]|nr:hypothetical protein [Bacteroidia bacterium]
MEIKTLLKLIKDDISHLDGITHDFNLSLRPKKEEVELALVRANALTKQLELLQKALAEPLLEAAPETKVEADTIPEPELEIAVIAPATPPDEIKLNIQSETKELASQTTTTVILDPDIAPLIVEELLEQEKTDLGYTLMPLAKIGGSIGINDRFLFIRELFANDSNAFDQAIEDLDLCHTIEQAVSYLKKNFKWTKNEASQKFLILVKRRFSN